MVLGPVDPAVDQRAEVTASPLRASIEQLADLPPALIITAEAHVLRDVGETYAARLAPPARRHRKRKTCHFNAGCAGDLPPIAGGASKGEKSWSRGRVPPSLR